jgi:ATP-binding cassette subfamily B protein RaxB
MAFRSSFRGSEAFMNVHSHFWFSRRRRLPVILASEAAECGLACITMVARFHGHDVDLNGLRQWFSLSLSGMSLRSLMGLANQLGLSPRPLRVELSALSKVQTPAILHWDLNHFVVLRSATAKAATIHDPAMGVRTLPLAEVSKHFTGVVLELTRATQFSPVQAQSPIRLSSLWSQITGLGPALAQVLALSVALQITAFAAPFQIQLVVDEAVFQADQDLLVVIALAFGALAVVQAAIEALRGWALRVFGHLLNFQIIGNVVRHMMRLPADFFEKRHVGDIFSRIGAVQPIQDAITRGLVAALIDGAMAFVAAAVLFFYSTLLATIVLLAVLLHFGISFALLPAMRHRMEEEILARAKEQSHLMETVRAATTIKLLGREAERESSWRNLYADVTNIGISVGKLQITQGLIQTLITGLVNVIVIYFGARLILAGDGFSVGMLFAFLSFRQTFSDRATAFINQLVQFRLMGLHLDRLADIVTAEPDTQVDRVRSIKVEGAIRVSEMSFRYGAADEFILKNIDLDVKAGDYVAITGPSGGGKTTLLKVLLGLHQPATGTVELDGHKADSELWRAWRTQVGVVAQEDRLLSGTIADNIAFFDPDLDMAKVQAAAMAAQVHEDIMRAPMQYLTLVGDMGSTLSGGQRQRVLLARALYNRPRVLFLDEGTANLDEATEEAIANLIEQLPITRIVVAHRPALIRRARRVLVVKDTQITEIAALAQGPSVSRDEASPVAPECHIAGRLKIAPSFQAALTPAEDHLASVSQHSFRVAPNDLKPMKGDEDPESIPTVPSRRRWVRKAGTIAAVLALVISTVVLWQRTSLLPREVSVTASQTTRRNSIQELPREVPSAAPSRARQRTDTTAHSVPDLSTVAASTEADVEQPLSHDSIVTALPPEPKPGLLVTALAPHAAKQSTSHALFQDCATCPEMVSIKRGTFLMGSQGDPSEKPLHFVTVRPFALGQFPVTVGEWRECSAARACSYQPSGDDAEPVRNINWNDAQQFLAWLSKLTNQAYRLPSEAEWEYAARAGAATKYWWGDQVLPGVANCRQCGGPYDPRQPAPVRSFRPNPLGLYDMAGGVAEWVSDCWHRDYRGAPKDSTSWDAPNCSERVLRGGSWKNDPSYLRLASRDHYDAEVRYPTHGFRVARSVMEGSP